ncbi:MAG: DUF3782 domain-containing protein [Desulfurococcales archaeon]|nr:DUF3782 domain-containing protein [Desulfurococcales archaeon]
MASLEKEAVKRLILDLVESDREFRYALMGVLGYREILDRITRLEERQQRLEERMARLEEEMRETRRVLAAIAHRFGVISEEGLREALKYVVQEVLGAGTVERRVLRDDEGIVYGHPSVVEVDVVVRDREHVLVEVKSRVSRADVAEAHRIAVLYERLTGVKPRVLVIGGFVDPQALELAPRLGVEVRSHVPRGP